MVKLISLTPRSQIPNTPTQIFDFQDDTYDPIELSNQMQTLVHDFGLISISGPQIGIDKRVIYVRGMESAMFNPKIVDSSEGQSVLDEVSSSIPDMIIKIKRPDVIRCRWTNAFGETNTYVYSGLTSRSIQRKIDYLNGIRLIDRAHKYHREQAISRWSKLNK